MKQVSARLEETTQPTSKLPNTTLQKIGIQTSASEIPLPSLRSQLKGIGVFTL